jgi:uncharacterized protein YdhG (YjbR/CyaY superfamily)
MRQNNPHQKNNERKTVRGNLMTSGTKGNQIRTMDEYIAQFPKNVRDILEELRRVIHETAPDAEEAMRYGIPTFRLNGNLVHFAAFKSHIGFYPAPSAISAFTEELSRYRHSKGTVQFPIDEPVPFELVREIVRYRLKENSERENKKK